MPLFYFYNDADRLTVIFFCRLKYDDRKRHNGEKGVKQTTRTARASKNIRSSLIGIAINFSLSFFSRRIFVMTLGKEFVGLGSLLGNLMAVISLFDFGASSAAVYCLYRPLSENDTKRVSDILVFYNKCCILGALLVSVAGILSIPFLGFFVPDSDDVRSIVPIFLIFVASNVTEYFFSSKKILLFADEKSYVTQFFSYFFGVSTVIAESAVLIFTKSYILYLVTRLVLQLCEDIVLSAYVKKLYPTIKTQSFEKTPSDVRKILLREISELQPSNIANTLLRTVDNFLIVRLFGISANGIYSNYNLLLSYASMLSVTLLSAISSTVGNIGASESKDRAKRIFFATNYISFVIICLFATELCVLSGDFIRLWLGGGMSLPGGSSVLLCALFFVSGMRRCTIVFRDAYGLYKKEKIKPYIELALSLVLSVFFGKKIGIAGIYLGQLISSVSVCLFYEPYILFKNAFGSGLAFHYKRLLSYAAILSVSCFCSYSLCRFFDSIITKSAICAAVALLFSAGIFCTSREFSDALCYLSGFLSELCTKKSGNKQRSHTRRSKL